MAILSTPLQYLDSIPPVTKGFTAATVAFSAVYYWVTWNTSPFSAPYLTLVPGSSLFYPWTFATSVFVETTPIELAISLIVVPPSLRYLERLWGATETLKFIFVPLVVSNIIAFAFNWIEYYATLNADLFLYGMQYRGQMAVQTAILVAFTQLIPEHQVQVMGVLKARVKTLPMAYLTFSTIICFLGFQAPYIIIQFAWLFSYIWLRFYKKNSGDTIGGTPTYGDRSETFAFVYWFPPFIHKPITILSNVAFNLATRFHLIPTTVPDVEGGYSSLPGPSGTRAEAERRRAMALKALDQRLANANASPAIGSSSPVIGPKSSDPSVHRSGEPAKATED